ncbi:MAG: MerR family transcriptional regulator [Candidatus Omnitrophica bacterium]|nr:MerR family transcriptional regulator [Candidatus Omnitrophota bacterium]
MNKAKFFTSQEVAQILGISKQTLMRYEKKGIFPKSKRNLINRWRQYSESDINKLKDIIRGNIE